jgi:hypothetical protein
MNSARRVSGSLVLALLVLALIPAALPAQEPQPASAALAQQLVALMEQMKLDSVAAREAQPDAYVAALYFPGQLMVVGARYSVPVLLNDKLAKKDYRDIYNDLNGAPVAGTKCLVMDLGANGLKADREEGQPFDTIETTTRALAFDGDWKAQKLSEEEYRKAFSDADARYAKMLKVLVDQLKKGSTD